jgi:uncharacterized cupredoxin-like copper-binding protein
MTAFAIPETTMKNNPIKHFRTLAIAALLGAAAPATPVAHAAGSHAAGHDHDAASAIGQPGDPTRVSRSIEIRMADDMRFTPAEVRVMAGETVRFVVINDGRLRHELVLGSEADLKAHYAEMLKAPEMEHDDANAVTLDGGKRGELVWQFTRGGSVPFGCLQPGHYDAGMAGVVGVR